MIHLSFFILFLNKIVIQKKFSLHFPRTIQTQKREKKMIFSSQRKYKTKNDIFSNHFHLFLTKPENQDKSSDIPISSNQSN